MLITGNITNMADMFTSGVVTVTAFNQDIS